MSAQRKLSEIASEIRSDWKAPYFGAIPYLQAMATLDTVDSRYHFDDGRSIVNYFLTNASTWRGEVAKKVKLELKQLLK